MRGLSSIVLVAQSFRWDLEKHEEKVALELNLEEGVALIRMTYGSYLELSPLELKEPFTTWGVCLCV